MKNLFSGGKNDKYFRTDHLKDDLKRRSVRGGAVTMVAQVFKFSLNLTSGVVLARLLTPQDYGLFGMVTAVTGFVSLFKDLGLSMATVQKEEITHEQVSILFWVNVAVSVITALITVAIAPAIAWFYQEPRLIWITLALSIGIIIGGLGVQHSALLNRQMQYKALMFNDILSMFSGILSGIVAAWYGAEYWALVIVPLISGVVSTTGFWIACSWRPGLPTRRSGVRSMLKFGGNLTGANIINYLARNVDNVLIGKVWGAEQLGLYSKAYQLLLLPLQQINAPISTVAVPTLSRLVESPKRYRDAYIQVLQVLSLLTLPLVVFMISTSDWIVWLLLGSQWSEASNIFALLGIIALTQPVSQSTSWIFLTQNRTNHLFQVGAINGGLAIAAIVAGLPWGAKGVALSYSVSGLLIRTPLLFWFVGRAGAVRSGDIYRTIAPFIVAAITALLAVFGFRKWVEISNPLLGLAIAFAINAGITLLIIVALPSGRQSLKNVRELVNIFNKKGK
ncbi:lipopolysaccharide biosynthesis protein [Tolypothrix sp. VBCCA 56010]|uniref:lipopolysaccharide biosynthesis protein n=1 Tax=Tolypothrix sp. VBCCA 56010 TaxID=3137731 RepID=UPI003D7DDDF2